MGLIMLTRLLRKLFTGLALPSLLALSFSISGCGGGGGSDTNNSALDTRPNTNPSSNNQSDDSDGPENDTRQTASPNNQPSNTQTSNSGRTENGQISTNDNSTENEANEFIVVFHNSEVTAQEVERHANEVASAVNGMIQDVFNDSMRGFLISGINLSQAMSIEQDNRVDYVEADREVQTFAVNLNLSIQFGAPWGLDRIDQPNLPLDGSFSYGNIFGKVHAYVIDTGINTQHNEFAGRIGAGFNATEKYALRIAKYRNSTAAELADCNGHGTQVASVIGGSRFGVAKSIAIHPVKALDCDGRGKVSDVIKGIEWITRHAEFPAIINLSIGGSTSPALDQAVRGAISRGIHVAVAAGNQAGNACLHSPARGQLAITTAASNRDDSVAAFSNQGRCVDLFAPGSEIPAASHEAANASTLASGSSLASAHVAGALAILLDTFPHMTPAIAKANLIDLARPLRLSGVRPGTDNLLLYIP